MVFPLSPEIYSVGVIDGDVRIFHGYEVPQGTTYNAYLVVDGDRAVLIDTVKAPFASELLNHLTEVLGEQPVTDLICNHVEPDHSGALPAVLAAYPQVTVYGTKACERELAAYYPETPMSFTVVGADDTLSTGHYTFRFIPMPMVHWPDSMCTYLEETHMLFSNDALGQHIGTGVRRDTELPEAELLERAGDYYANIVMPYGSQVQRLLATLGGLEISLVAPAHGVVLFEHLGAVLHAYDRWSRNAVDAQRALIVYDTMYGTTAELARRIAAEWEARGLHVETINLSETHYSRAVARLLEARYLAVGSPTLNNRVLPTVAAFLTYVGGLRPTGRIGRAFGSFGWSGESVKDIQAALEAMGCEMEEPVSARWHV